MKKYKLIAIVAFFVSFISGCYYDKADVLFPVVSGNTCDTSAVKYSTDVLPILNASCVGCHSTNSTSPGRNRWSIQNFSTLQTRALSGSLVFRITLPATHPSLMPLGGPKLDTCNILKIKAWVNKGALNN